jgi:hypothetical protein
MVQFFVPHLRDDPDTAEAEWQRYLNESPAPFDSRRVHSLIYEHNGDKYEVTVGQPRKRYAKETGPRGGYIKNVGHQQWASDTGTTVSGIIDTRGDLLYVWSYGPPFGDWANPSFVGRVEVRRIDYFDEPSVEASEADGT